MENIATALARAGGGCRERRPQVDTLEPPNEEPQSGELQEEIPQSFDVQAQILANELPKLSETQREVLMCVSYWLRQYQKLQRRNVIMPDACCRLYLELLDVQSFLTNMGRDGVFRDYKTQTEIFAIVRPFRNMLAVLKQAETSS